MIRTSTNFDINNATTIAYPFIKTQLVGSVTLSDPHNHHTIHYRQSHQGRLCKIDKINFLKCRRQEEESAKSGSSAVGLRKAAATRSICEGSSSCIGHTSLLLDSTHRLIFDGVRHLGVDTDIHNPFPG
jgi:hypothetical protein